MPRPPRLPAGLSVWRIQGLRDLELRRDERHAVRAEPQVHSQFEIAVVEGAGQLVRHRGTTHCAPPGGVIVIAPGEAHAHAPSRPGSALRSFYPDLASLIDASSSTGVATPSFRTPIVADAELAACVSALHRMLERAGSVLAREVCAVDAATMLVSRHAMRARSARPMGRAARAVECVREHLHDRLDANVSLAELTALTGLPAHTLVRAFTAHVGMPPHAYHVHVRIERAKKLLARGHGAAAVAAATGFVDQSHLTRHFRRCVGVTPGAYVAAVVP